MNTAVGPGLTWVCYLRIKPLLVLFSQGFHSVRQQRIADNAKKQSLKSRASEVTENMATLINKLMINMIKVTFIHCSGHHSVSLVGHIKVVLYRLPVLL